VRLGDNHKAEGAAMGFPTEKQKLPIFNDYQVPVSVS
jgi:hypothetical protein